MANSLGTEATCSPFITQEVEELGSGPRKFLQDDDVRDILDAMVSVGRDQIVGNKNFLKHWINEAVRKSNIARAILRSEPMHERIEELEQVQSALEKAQSAINPMGKQRERLALHHQMAVELDRLADPHSAREPVMLERSQSDAIGAYTAATAAFPEFADDELCGKIFRGVPHVLTLTLPSDAASKQVDGALDGLALLVRLLGEHVATLRRRQASLGTKKRPRNADHARYVLILDLVRVFEVIFGQLAAMTREGACCRFLSAVLSRCEPKKLSPDGAYDSWRDARQWLETR